MGSWLQLLLGESPPSFLYGVERCHSVSNLFLFEVFFFKKETCYDRLCIQPTLFALSAQRFGIWWEDFEEHRYKLLHLEWSVLLQPTDWERDKILWCVSPQTRVSSFSQSAMNILVAIALVRDAIWIPLSAWSKPLLLSYSERLRFVDETPTSLIHLHQCICFRSSQKTSRIWKLLLEFHEF